MGAYFSKVWQSIFNLKTEARILMLGLDAAGKTTVLYKLKLGETTLTIPTVGFNIETVEYKNLCFILWDVGGQKSVRELWQHYHHGTNVILFVADSNDRDRIDEAREKLWSILESEELRDASLLVLANKQDLPNAMEPSEVTTGLGLHKLPTTRKWYVQASCATNGSGIYEGLDWLGKKITQSIKESLALLL